MRWIVFAFLALFFFFSCKKYDRVNPRDGIAGVTTSEAKQVNFSTVQISSSLTSVEGVSFISQRGVCWSTNPNPTVADAFTNQGSGFGTFVSTIEGLSANTTYYFRSFASNDKAIAYGNEVSFKIIAVLNVETKAATSIGFTAATIGGKLVSNGGYTIKLKGLFWGVYPGISEKNELITADQSDFDYQLTNLENGKTYYYRAFALTNEGYVFGEELNFTTLGYNSPSLTTNSITSIGVNSAVSGGVITSDGALPISAKGICWSKSSNPTTSDAKTNEGSGSDNFSSKLSGLQEGTTYYVRAYATNSKGTSYGNEVSFTTYALNKPILSTNTITNITSTSATSGGTISSDGGASITVKGICWSTTSNPTIANNKTNEGTGVSNFSSQLSGLQEGTTYYVRSYATNSKGTSYGNEVSFTTTAINKPIISTNSITNISISSATSGGAVSSDGGASITAKGICWSTSSNPTLSDNPTNQGIGPASFTSQLTGLKEATKYYVRAYATNSKGTSYGNEVSFTTYTINKPILSTNSITNITTTNATSGGTISSDGGASITAKGICWSTTSNATIANNKTNEGTGVSNFSSQLLGLQEGTTYYVRSYATNSKGTSYGNEVSFTTTAINKPTLITNTITNISSTRATSGGVISSDGGASISAKGICWSTSNNPTVANSKTNEGTGVGSFTSQMTGLQEGAMYYVRAYATNSKGTSYGQEVSFAANEMLIDIEGNKYKTVKIGTQLWMAENLKVSKYNDGVTILNITDSNEWPYLSKGAWVYYNNDASYNAKYGKLYNWYVASPTTNGNKNICPTGWHVPSNAEWTILTDYLGGETVAGGKMKEVGTTNWISPNTNATNSSFFSALPAGNRFSNGYFSEIGSVGYWWSSTQSPTGDGWFRSVDNNSGNVSSRGSNVYGESKRAGMSIRCLRD